MKEKIKVSVIIPVYNAEKYLSECLDSVLNQSLEEIEVICIDDGSTDRSFEILEDYSKKNKKIHLIHQENSGASKARNRGILEASGEYLCFIDADDTVNQGFITKTFTLAKKEDADLIIFGGETFPKKENWAEKHLCPQNIIYDTSCWKVIFEDNSSRPFACNKMFRASILKGKIEFDSEIKIGEDQAFMFDVIPLCNKIVCTEEKFYNYRMHSSSAIKKANSDIHYKVSQHKKIILHVIKSWVSNKWINEATGPLLADWVINVLKYDIMSLGFDFKKELCCFIMQQLDKICDRNLLSEESKSYLNQIEKTVNHVWKPVISVIIPVYNSSSYLHETIDCLLKQKFTDFEIIFIDDGSSDNSVEILENLAKYDSRITVLKQEHKFAGAARNYGIKKACGEYMIFLDSDDFYAPEMLEIAYSRIKETDADICVFRADQINQETKQKSRMEWTCCVELCELGKDNCFSRTTNPKHIFDFTTPDPCNKLIKKSLIQKSNLEFQQTRSANDMAFIFTALCLAEKITAINDVLFTYKVNNKTFLQGSQDKKADAFYDAIKELKYRLINYGVYNSVEEAFINFSLNYCFYNLGTLRDPITYEKIHLLILSEALNFIEAKGKAEEYFYAYKENNNYEKMQDIQKLSMIDYASKWNRNIIEQSEFYKTLKANEKKASDILFREIEAKDKLIESKDKSLTDMNKKLKHQDELIIDINKKLKNQDKLISDMNKELKNQNEYHKKTKSYVKIFFYFLRHHGFKETLKKIKRKIIR